MGDGDIVKKSKGVFIALTGIHLPSSTKDAPASYVQVDLPAKFIKLMERESVLFEANKCKEMDVFNMWVRSLEPDRDNLAKVLEDTLTMLYTHPSIHDLKKNVCSNSIHITPIEELQLLSNNGVPVEYIVGHVEFLNMM